MRKRRLVVWLAVLVALFGLGALTMRLLGQRDAAPVQAEKAMPDAHDTGPALPPAVSPQATPDRSAMAPATPAPDAAPGLPAGPALPPAASPQATPDRSAMAPATPAPHAGPV